VERPSLTLRSLFVSSCLALRVVSQSGFQYNHQSVTWEPQPLKGATPEGQSSVERPSVILRLVCVIACRSHSCGTVSYGMSASDPPTRVGLLLVCGSTREAWGVCPGLPKDSDCHL